MMIDNETTARNAVEHLISLGHTRIACISGPLQEIMSIHGRNGYRNAMATSGLAIPEGYKPVSDYLLHTGKRQSDFRHKVRHNGHKE